MDHSENKKLAGIKSIGSLEKDIEPGVKEIKKDDSNDYTKSNLTFLSSDPRVNYTEEDSKSLDVFQKIYNLISDRISGDTSRGEAILKLHPDAPGELRVGIFLDESKISIRLVASNELVGNLVSSNLESLKRNLTQSGFDIISLNVYIMNNGSYSHRDREGYNWHFLYHHIVKESDIIELKNNDKNLIDLLV